MTDENKNKKIAVNLMKLVNYTKKMRFLLLSATPMYNNYKEIIWLINLMNANDNRHLLNVSDIFDKNGNFLTDADGNDVGKELFIQKITGYISFVRGDNPYTFPYRIFPKFFSPENTIIRGDYPLNAIDKTDIWKYLEFSKLF